MNAIATVNNRAPAIELFTRGGSPFVGVPRRDAKGRPFTVRERACTRCGGQGGSHAWKHTGYTCYDCGGSGKHKNGPETAKLYTRQQIDRLNATAAKKAAKRQVAFEAKAAAQKAEADARRGAFLAEHGELLERAAKVADRSEFVADVIERAKQRASMSDKQAAAVLATVEKIENADTMRAASGHVGEIGQRIEIAVTVERVYEFSRPRFGYEHQSETVYIVTMRDAGSNAIVSKSPRFAPEKGDKFTLRATVKDHSEYRGEKQTVVQRCAIIKEKETEQ